MRLADGNRIFLREEGHSNSNLIAIVLDNRPPQRNEFLAFWGGFSAATSRQRVHIRSMLYRRGRRNEKPGLIGAGLGSRVAKNTRQPRIFWNDPPTRWVELLCARGRVAGSAQNRPTPD